MKYSWPKNELGPHHGKRVVLITGSREWTDKKAITDILGIILPHVVIHGGARGADTITADWCFEVPMVREEAFGVEWKGNKVDYLRRNQVMVERTQDYAGVGAKVLCIAFPLPGGSGTLDCMERAVLGGIPVLQYQ